MIRNLRRSLRLTALILWLLLGGGIAVWFGLLARRHQRTIMQRWFAGVLALVGVRLAVAGQTGAEHGRVAVANHLSWLDIVVLNVWHPCCFIAKSEIRRWPLIGWLSAQAGTLFINRERRRDALALGEQLRQAVGAGEWVVFFPEGEVGDGVGLLPFHAALFQPVIESNLPLYAVALDYRGGDGRRSFAASFHEVSLLASVWRLLGERDLVAHVTCSPPLLAGEPSRRELAQKARDWIAGRLYPKASGSSTAGPRQGS